MKKFIFAIVTAVALSVGATAPAEAAPKCHSKVLVQETQTRNVTGVLIGMTYDSNGVPHPVYGNGIQKREYRVVRVRCGRSVMTLTSYTPWTNVPGGRVY